ncbi:MAG: class II fructose-bisphosphatase [Acidimicrobiia bacterium]|nr:class II fructose-bisphosphatase [Acidimicrobiia bacterium]MDX2467797.1 class II fructose-bisphosphatase [Acidimicrobiia bacterium]
MTESPDRNLALELVRVTEVAAIAAARYQGRGDKEAVDQAAVDAMRQVLSTIDMDGIVVIGEGEKDEAPMLFNGEVVGNGKPPLVDVAVDPVDGTRLTARGMPGSLAVIALAPRGTMYAPGSLVYMDKIAVGPEAAGKVDIEAPVAHNLAEVAKAIGKPIGDVTAIILDRPRNEPFVTAVREAGARIALIGDGDISGSISTAKADSGIDILLGVGGSPEAVTSACAMAALDGEIQCKLWPRDDSEREFAKQEGLDLNQVLTTRDLVNSDNTFFAATGVTSGELLDGVRFGSKHVFTNSLVLRSKTGTARYMNAIHKVEQLRNLSAFEL